MKVLIISPHPDDLEIWMGATAAKLVLKGHDVRSVILTDGRRSPRSFQCSDDEMAAIRKEEGIKAHEVLGINDFEFYDLRNTKDEKKVREIISNELAKNFDRVYVSSPEDAHPTHAEVGKILPALAKEIKIQSEIFAYDGWNFLCNPDKYEDVEGYVEKKVAAIRCHKSQVKDTPYDEAMEKFARVRAILMSSHEVTNVKQAEAFKKLN